jgi:hypothetical protein
VTTLLELQGAPVDVCNLFHGELGGFGLFNEYGVPQKNYYALRAFSSFLETERRVETRGSTLGRLALAAGVNTNGTRAAILISNFAVPQESFRLAVTNLPWASRTVVEIRRVTMAENLNRIVRQTNAMGHFTVSLDLVNPAVALIQFQPVEE